MAGEEAAADGGKNALGFLAHKAGPFPVGVWVAIGLAFWWYLQRQNKKTATPGQQTDPAGNVGSIDPATGYVYGSSQDTAAIAANNGSGSGGGGGSGSPTSGSGSTTAGQYATNADWGRAAENYLVGLGLDPTAASQAIQQYLSSQNLTPDQQGMINLVIQGLGAPPELPTPSQNNPPSSLGGTGTGSTGGGPTATNPPTGVAMDANVSSSTLAVRWNQCANATGYNIQIDTNPDFAHEFQTYVPSSQTSVTVGNLNPGTTYYFRVQAVPASANAGWGGPVSGTTAGAGVGTGRGGPEAPVTSSNAKVGA